MKRILFVLALLPVLLATACADDDLQPRRNETDLEALDRLVPITQSGAGTFGCLLNGELWIPEGGFVENYIDALASTTNPNNITITVHKRPVSDERDHIMTIGSIFIVENKSPLDPNSGWFDKNAPGECKDLDVDVMQDNYLLVQFHDTTDKIISGKFEAVMVNSDCPQDTARVTEGRFDLPYRD